MVGSLTSLVMTLSQAIKSRDARQALTHRTLRMRNEKVVKQLPPSSATGNRLRPRPSSLVSGQMLIHSSIFQFAKLRGDEVMLWRRKFMHECREPKQMTRLL